MSRRQLFGSLCAMVFLVNLARVVFAPLLEPLAADFEVTAAALGTVATAAWLGSAVPRLPTGYLLTRVARHRVVAGTGVVLTGASLFVASVDSVAALTVGAFLMGLASGAYFIAANPLVSELFPTRVGTAIGVHGTAAQVAAAGAPLLVLAVLAVDDWRLTFHLLAGVAALATVALVAVSRRADLPGAGAEDRELLAAVRGQARIVATGVVIIGVAGFVWNGFFNYYVTYLVEGKAFARATAQQLLSVMFAAGIPAFLVTGRLADRVPNVPLLLAIVGGFAGSVLALTVVGGFWPVVAVTLLLGYVAHSLFPAIDTYLLASLPDHHRASAYAGYSAAMMIVQAFGSVAVGTLAGAGVSYDVVFRSFAGIVLAVLAVMVVLYAGGRLPAGRAHETDRGRA